MCWQQFCSRDFSQFTFITKLVVDGLKAEAKDLLVWDRDLKGFCVRVTPTGKKIYFSFYRTMSGKQRKPAIGMHGKVTTEEARQIAKKWIKCIEQGSKI